MSPEGFIAQTDQEKSGYVSSTHFIRHLDEQIKVQFKEREKYAICNMLDLSKSGQIDCEVLKRELLSVHNLINDPQKLKLALEVKDKVLIRPIKPRINPIANNIQTSQVVNEPGTHKQPQQLEDQFEANITTIVNKLQTKTPMSIFLLSCLENCQISKGNLDLNDLQKYLTKAYSNIITAREISLLVKLMDNNRNNKIDLDEFREFFRQYCKDPSAYLDLTLRIISKGLDVTRTSTSDYLKGSTLNYEGKGIELHKPLKFEDFSKTIASFMKIDDADAQALYKTVDSKNEGEGTLKSYLSDAQRADRTDKQPPRSYNRFERVLFSRDNHGKETKQSRGSINNVA